jgi:hypothetical protein
MLSHEPSDDPSRKNRSWMGCGTHVHECASLPSRVRSSKYPRNDRRSHTTDDRSVNSRSSWFQLLTLYRCWVHRIDLGGLRFQAHIRREFFPMALPIGLPDHTIRPLAGGTDLAP